MGISSWVSESAQILFRSSAGRARSLLLGCSMSDMAEAVVLRCVNQLGCGTLGME